MKKSRQYQWQQKKMTKGRCARCGAKRKHYTVLCDSCQVEDRIGQQQRSGSRPWHEGERAGPKVRQPLPGRGRR